MKYQFLFLFLFCLTACTRKNSTPEVLTPKQTQTKIPRKIKASKKNCFEMCQEYRVRCEKLAASVLTCQEQGKIDDCEKPISDLFALFSMDIFQLSTCKEACWNVANENPLLICEEGGGKGFKDLTSKALNLILKSNAPEMKALQLSSQIKRMGNPSFNRNYDKRLNDTKTTSPGRFFVVQSFFKDPDLPGRIDLWLKKEELRCLGSRVQKAIKQREQKRQFGILDFDLSDLQGKIFDDCKFPELQFFNGEKLLPIDPKTAIISYYSISPKDDECFYPTPRIEIAFPSESSNALVFLPKVLKLTQDLSTLNLTQFINKHPAFYNLPVGEFYLPMEMDGIRYLFAAVPAMTDCFTLFQLTEWGPVEISTQCNEPCGS